MRVLSMLFLWKSHQTINFSQHNFTKLLIILSFFGCGTPMGIILVYFNPFLVVNAGCNPIDAGRIQTLYSKTTMDNDGFTGNILLRYLLFGVANWLNRLPKCISQSNWLNEINQMISNLIPDVCMVNEDQWPPEQLTKW